ncbi:amino acid adenylation domain-containing protein [Streptomyces sp. NPDC020707]|uniref:amino acid adenylation domain-containing protein n=1 Tax=Streptomyces sp. NPDC020707 TaxID=3365084 RepID=UPI003795FAA1
MSTSRTTVAGPGGRPASNRDRRVSLYVLPSANSACSSRSFARFAGCSAAARPVPRGTGPAGARSRGSPLRRGAGETGRRGSAPRSVAVRRGIVCAPFSARAGRLTERLRAAGARGNAPVGILLERSPEFVTAMLAVLNTGGCYVPLDPEYPTARLHTMLATADVRMVVSSTSFAGRLPDSVDAIDAGHAGDETHPAAESAPPSPVHPDNLAYIMFTSGSTGTPKAVAVPHSGITRLVDKPNYVHLDADEVLAHLSSPSFDASTFEIWGALANGARLVIGPPGPTSAQQVADLLRTGGVTGAWLTAGLFNLMVDEYLDGLSDLRQLLTGGDAMSPTQAGKFLTAVPACLLINAYGPTEVTTFTTCHTVTPADTLRGRVPIGRPVTGTWVEVLDEEHRPVPAGRPGLLHAGGLGVARGYVGNPARTAERFVPDPSAAGRRRYATGDLAAYREDGTIDFLGRADRQLKKRGFRVEPAEIEETLRRDPLVKDVTVALRGSQADQAFLVAYVVVEPQAQATVDQVEKRSREQLPDHLVPDRFLTVDALPLTSNGKVDHNALAALPQQPEPGAGNDAPLTGTETTLAEIWCEILHLPSVGRHDDFFAHGGQSLQAGRVEARIRSRFGVTVSLRSIFDHPTIAELAHRIDRSRDHQQGDGHSPT